MRKLNALLLTSALMAGLSMHAMAAPTVAEERVVEESAHNKQPTKQLVSKQRNNKKVNTKVIVRTQVARPAPQRQVQKPVSHKHKQTAKRYTAANTHRVRAGDTLSHIAARYRVTVRELMRLNKLTAHHANHLNIGLVIKLL